MNTKTILAFANDLGTDAIMMNQVLANPPTPEAALAAKVVGTNITEFHHKNFDMFAKLSTSDKDLMKYNGPCGDAVRMITMFGYSDWMKIPPQQRDYRAIATRGVDFNELVRRDFIRAAANAEWLYNKQVFEFSDELLLSLLSDMTEFDLTDLLKAHKIETTPPKEFKDVGFIEMRLFLDRMNLLPFRTFVIDVSGNRMFKGSGIGALQVTPLYYPENYKAIVHVEVIKENGEIHGTYAYDVDYRYKRDCIMEDNGAKFVKIVLWNSQKISDMITGKTGAINFIESQKHGDEYNSIIGAVVCQVINYLGSDGADVSESPDTKTTYKPTTSSSRIRNTYKEIQKWDCGFKYAESVRQYQRAYESAQATGTGSPKKPHVRRAHWHHFWTGSGENRKLIRKWLPAINVNMDFTSDLVLTVRKEG